MRRALLSTLLLLAACDGDEGPVGVDISGRYNLQVTGIGGCDEDATLVAWMEGPLEVRGADSAFVFDFGEPFVVDGGTTEGGRFSFGGSVQSGEVEYAVFGSGDVEGSAGSFTLAGQGGAQVDDDGDPSNDCTIQAPFQAVQIAE